ncbi:MAG: deoxyribodipyrimidine photo-lyase [Bdellovibrionales bacterium]|nr:deoxyribodipyrimidine photo-lyase [Bdellovibrionales bacterium]
MPNVHGPVSLFWFRRDLRTVDNHGLWQALRREPQVMPVFILDEDILKRLPARDARVEFILEALRALNQQFCGRLRVLYGKPKAVFARLFEQHNISAVFTNEDYEPYARRRDQAVAKFCRANGAEFLSFKDQVIFGPEEILKDDGTPYKVYGAYARRWRARYQEDPPHLFASSPLLAKALSKNKIAPAPRDKMPTLGDLGFKTTGMTFPPNKSSRIHGYARHRDLIGEDATSHLGIHLRFGTRSVRQLFQAAAPIDDTFASELIWREFFMQILYHFPHSAQAPFDPRYEHIRWRNDKAQFKRWCLGKTGYPLVDAGMRELNATGFMHNRARMITASFLCKHLLIDWRWGERYFAEKLLDYDMAANVGNWQWAAGSGCDAAPYFRVFNPTLQQKKFDANGKYVKRWVPELRSESYPEPMVEHEFARRRALRVYNEGLKK